MALRTKIRVSQVTGSFGTATGQINDQIAGVATGSISSSDLSSVLSHLAASIKRIHGASSFTEGTAGIFKQSLTVTGSITSTTGLSGSLTKLADGTSYLIAGSNVTITSASNGAVTISAAGGGGGSGTNFFLDTAGAGVLYTTASSIAFPFGEAGIDAATDKGSDVRFYVSGSTSSTPAAVALFGGNLISSGSIIVKSSTGATAASITPDGVISGSSNLQAGGNLTVAGTSALVGDVTVTGDVAVNGGDITTTSSTFNFLPSNATSINVGGASATVNVQNLDVNGTSDLAGNITLSGNSQTVTHSGTGNLTIASTSGNVVVEGTVFSGDDVTVKGNLTVQGTTTTIDTTNLLVKDPIILMASGTAGPNKEGGIAIFSGSSTGTELVFGRIANDTWGAGTLDTQNGTVTTFASMTMAGIRASNFQVGTSTAKQIQLNGNNLAINSDARIELTGSTIGLVINNAENFLIGTNTGGNFVRIASGTVGSNVNVALFRGDTGKDVALRGEKVHFVASGSTHVATVSSTSVTPSATNTYDLGESGTVWKNLYATNITVTGRGKFTSEVTSSVSADTNYQVSGLDWSAITAANRDKFIDVFVNGSLLLTGSDAGAGSRDYYLGTSNDGVKFTFALTVDDVVAVVVR